MAINERLIDTEVAAAAAVDTDNLMLDLDASDVDSYDGDGDVWYDIHDFEYKPTTNVAQHFNTVLWSGDDSSSRSITDVGFEPDLIWVKARQAQNHTLYDSVRGTGKYVASDTANSEDSSTTYGQLTSFDDDGFTGSKGSDANFSFFNSSSQTYVAWCWKAGGAAVLNEEGSIDSQVSVNNDLGFSIVKWSGDGSSATVGHGLDTPPELTIKKNLDYASDWAVNTYDRGGHYMFLNNTNAELSSSQSVNSTTFTAAGTTYNRNGTDLIAYCFASKRGVSKVGSYTGTGAAGNKVYTGFEPAFIMTKRSSTSGDNWNIIDNVRDTDTNKNAYLKANTNGTETDSGTSITFNRDGFTLNGGSFNTSSQTHIYYAVAKNTNETSLIPDTDLELHLDADSFPEKGEAGYSNTPTTWTDSSSNSNDGTITGATFDSELGNYLDFDGSNDYVSTSYVVSATNDYTFEGWFNQDVAEGIIAWGMNNGNTNEQIYGGIESDGDVRLGASTGANHLLSTSQPITVGKWHHIVWVYKPSANVRKIYVDGEEVASSTSSWSKSSAGIAIYIGSRNTSGTAAGNFDGKVGQFRVYDTDLTEAQIRQNYNFTKPSYPNYFHADIAGGTHNPAGYFDFDSSSDYVTVPATSTTPIDVRQSFSVATWVKLNVINATHNFIENYSNGGTISFTLGVLSTGIVNVTLRSGSTDTNISTTETVTAGSFTHIAVTRTVGTDVKIYLDGELVKTQAYTSTPNISSSNVFTIGGKQWAFDGEISKVKMYNAALSETEIEALYNEGE